MESTSALNGFAPNRNEQPDDLVGGPFAVLESDPGVFTTLIRKLGIRGLEVEELYAIEPWAVDHLHPHGLIFCFLWRKDTHRPSDFDDPAAERVWFANQLSDDACASLAILNVLLNCPNVELGEELAAFRAETESFSPIMKGLGISNLEMLRQAHNSLSRPADIRGALNAVANTTVKLKKQLSQNKSQTSTSPIKKRKISSGKSASVAKAKTKTKAKAKAEMAVDDEDDDDDDEEETYHFIGYVPAHGKVWELDGLKSGPLEVGELPNTLPLPHPQPQPEPEPTTTWMDIVRPALRLKMQKHHASAGDIRFNLLALVDDRYVRASDELELIKREKHAVEKRLDGVYPNGWTHLVDPSLLPSSHLSTSVQPSTPGRTFTPAFGARKMQMEVRVLDAPARSLVGMWEACVRAGIRVKVGVEDEVGKAERAHTDSVQRTHDYEPFIEQFVAALHREGLLNPLLGRDENGRKLITAGSGGSRAKTKK